MTFWTRIFSSTSIAQLVKALLLPCKSWVRSPSLPTFFFLFFNWGVHCTLLLCWSKCDWSKCRGKERVLCIVSCLLSKWQEENGLSSRLFDFLQCKQHSSTGPNLSQSPKEKLERRAKSLKVLRKNMSCLWCWAYIRVEELTLQSENCKGENASKTTAWWPDLFSSLNKEGSDFVMYLIIIWIGFALVTLVICVGVVYCFVLSFGHGQLF